MSGVDPSEETRYRFLPSVRRGLRPDAAFPDDPAMRSGTVTVVLDVEGSSPDGSAEEVEARTDIRLYGPGDVIGLDSRQVVRTEPVDGTTDYPPNYFPHVEFDRADLPWLFSPERANDADGRARPWLTLVVVERREGVSLDATTGRPLPVLTIRGEASPEEELPPPDEVWAWAHAQVVGAESTLGADAVTDSLDSGSTRTLSRLIAPRKLEANTAYYACVVPTFEAGRLAGLGEDSTEPLAGRPVTAVAWTPVDGDAPLRLPVYYHWAFATGPRGDFESLVRALEPRELGMEVGSRSVDLSDPGAEPVAAPWLVDGSLRLGGALRSVTFDPKHPVYPHPSHPEAPEDLDTREGLRGVVNRPDDLATATGDPVVGPPTYGQWHADVARLPEADEDDSRFLDSWLDELNLDPRNRLTAAFGTRVVQDNQEALMTAAWEQFGDLTWANQVVRAAQVARAIGDVTSGALKGVPTADLLSFTAPMHGMLRWAADSDRTVHGRLEQSQLPRSVVRPSFRRLTRPRGPLSRRVGGSLAAGPFVERFAAGTDILDPGAGLVESVPSLTDRLAEAGELGTVGDRLAGGRPSMFGRDAVIERDYEVESDGGTDGAGPNAGDASPLLTAVHGRLDSVDDHCLTARRRLTPLELALEHLGVTDEPASVESTLDRLLGERPTIEARCEAIAGSTFRPLARSLARLLAGAPEAAPGLSVERKDELLGEMGDQHVDLMAAVRGVHADDWTTDREAALDDVRASIEHLDRIMELVEALRRALGVGNTAMAYTADDAPADVRPLSLTDVPDIGDLIEVEAPLVEMVADRLELARDWLETAREDPLEEVMAAPEIAKPMYGPLRDLSPAYLCPGVGNIPTDTVGVLETNPPFVEAYMVGLSHEMARELLWRRYPTDRRGTYFRHFWDRRAVPADGDGSSGDIEPIHHWLGQPLGDNAPGRGVGADDDGSRLVLIIRGKLLQRYPNTRIYAVKAVDEDNDDEDDDVPDRVPLFEPRRRELLDVLDRSGSDVLPDEDGGYRRTDLESWAPKEPVFRGTLAEDVTFFGFDLTDEAAFGTEADPDDRGWFFVLEEPPGEPRFGLDVATDEEFGAVPHGVSYGPDDGGREMRKMDPETWEDGPDVGWNALSWGHLVVDESTLAAKTHLEVTADRPAGGDDPAWAVVSSAQWTDGFDPERTWTDRDEARWGENSAHMARITWQLPVRVAVHADDMLPAEVVSALASGGSA